MSKKIINKYRKLTKHVKIPKIQSRRNFRPKFKVGLWSSKNAKTDGVALFFPPTVSSNPHPQNPGGMPEMADSEFRIPHSRNSGHWPIVPPREIAKFSSFFGFCRSIEKVAWGSPTWGREGIFSGQSRPCRHFWRHGYGF